MLYPRDIAEGHSFSDEQFKKELLQPSEKHIRPGMVAPTAIPATWEQRLEGLWQKASPGKKSARLYPNQKKLGMWCIPVIPATQEA
jgi:hypothetical protein